MLHAALSPQLSKIIKNNNKKEILNNADEQCRTACKQETN